MFEFERICREFERLDPIEYTTLLTVKSAKLLPFLDQIEIDGEDGKSLFFNLVVASALSDGKLSEEEYLLLYPAIHAVLGDEFDYETAKAVVKEIRPATKEYKKMVDNLVDFLGKFDDELKEDIITVAFLVCAVDGKISHKEKQWIKQLIK